MVPTIVRRIHRLKKARGFSVGELREAGLNLTQARSMKVRTDERRSSVHAKNVEALKTFLTPVAEPAAPQPLEAAPVEEVPEKKKAPAPAKKVKPRRAKRAAKRKA
jgi:hypothetical protein